MGSGDEASFPPTEYGGQRRSDGQRDPLRAAHGRLARAIAHVGAAIRVPGPAPCGARAAPIRGRRREPRRRRAPRRRGGRPARRGDRAHPAAEAAATPPAETLASLVDELPVPVVALSGP